MTSSSVPPSGLPLTAVEDPSQVPFNPDLGKRQYRYTYPTGEHLDALLNVKPSDTLIVSFHGPLNRSRYALPRFERLELLDQYDASSLFLADPTLWRDETLQLAWYTGWEEEDVQATLATWVTQAAQAIGASSIILTGSSGGGFAALQVSALVPGSVCLAFNPSTFIHGYLVDGEPGAHGTERKYMEVLYPERAPEGVWKYDFTVDWTQGLGPRMSVLDRYSDRRENWVLLAQNPNDWHQEQHSMPFLAAAARGGNIGRIRVMEYDGEPGHAPPHPDVVQRGMALALDWARELAAELAKESKLNEDASRMKNHDHLTDDELADMGMYRCGCGAAVYPDGNRDRRHCALDRPPSR